MRFLFAIDTLHGQAWYDLFYVFAIVVACVFFLVYGKRRSYPMAAWSLLFAGGIIFFIAGTKLVMFDAADWRALLSAGQFPEAASKSVLGGILFGTLGIWLGKRLTRFPFPVLDALAVGLPFAMAIQRIGCFVAGCCYGTPTNAPWGMTYSVHAAAFHDHLAHGWIDPGAAASMPVHPTQLYQVLLCLLIAIITWRMRHFFQRQGSLFLFSIGLYLAARFVVEFWNSPETAWLDSITGSGLKNIQWLLLAGIIWLTGMILRREHEPQQEGGRAKPHTGLTTILFLALAAIALKIGHGLTPVEGLVIQMVLLPAWYFQLRTLFASWGKRQGTWAAGAYALSLGLVFSSVLTGQQLYRDLTDNDNDRNTFYEITGGYGQLTYGHYHEAPTSGTGCNGGTVYYPRGPSYRQKEQVFGAGFKSIQTKGQFERLEVSSVISAGREMDLDDPAKPTIGTLDIGGGFKLERRWIGMGIGLHTGSAMHDEKRGDVIYTTDHRNHWYVSLSGSIRFFPYDIFYCEYRYNELMPYQIMGRATVISQFLVGSGFGLKNGTALELGADANGAFFIGGKVIIKNTYGIRATVYNERAARDAWHVSDIGLIYRFRK